MRASAYRRAIADIARLAADPNVPILIEGESGTGKTRIARQVHAWSSRASGPFVTVLLSALDDTLAGSELFGHVAGAYTDARRHRSGSFASAHGGTLFLDEIAKATPGVQRKLLHAIEYGTVRPLGSDREIGVDARIVAATNVPLSEAVMRGEFLPDLYARVEVFRVVLPPLRARRADIPALIASCLESAMPRDSLPQHMEEPLMRALQHAPWPNNLRQLSATVRRLVIEAEGSPVISLAHCRGPLAYLRNLATAPSRDDVERAVVEAGHNVSRAAKTLGIHRATLYRRRQRDGRREGDNPES